MMGCLPPLSHNDWQFEPEDQCMYKGYYNIDEVVGYKEKELRFHSEQNTVNTYHEYFLLINF